MIEPAALFGLSAGAVGVATTVPYVRDTLRRTTVPHRGAWLVWSLLEIVSVEAQRADGAGWSLLPLLTQALGTCLVFALSVRLGSGGLSRPELVLMALAGGGVAGWMALDEPVVATSCVIAADLLAVVMMMPKTWRDPYSETTSMFALAALCGALTIASVESDRPGLLIYPVYFTLVNAAVAAIIVHRRRVLGSAPPAASVEVPRPRSAQPQAASAARAASASPTTADRSTTGGSRGLTGATASSRPSSSGLSGLRGCVPIGGTVGGGRHHRFRARCHRIR